MNTCVPYAMIHNVSSHVYIINFLKCKFDHISLVGASLEHLLL